jgi:fructose-1-phosphate kinase PfkB-like protein
VILVACLNTAHERIVSLERLEPGRVHRATNVIATIGGKPVNVARSCGRMGVPVHLMAVADAGTAELLRAEPDLNLATIEIEPSPVGSRTDTVLVESDGRATVVNGVVAVGDPSALSVTHDRVQDRVAELLRPGDLLVLAGSYPGSGVLDRYRALTEVARARGARTILDASGPWLSAALPARPELLKLSLDELSAATGVDRETAWADGRAALAAIELPPSAVIITDGSRGARAWTAGEAWAVPAPIARVVNPVGAGDAATAGLATALSRGATLSEAVADAVAWATAAVGGLDLVTDPVEATRIRREVTPEALAPS